MTWKPRFPTTPPLVIYGIAGSDLDRARYCHRIQGPVEEPFPLSEEHRQAIAAAVRESSGGLPGVQALGLALGDRVQVSTNLIDVDATPLHRLVERIGAEAEARRAAVGTGELVGLVPAEPLELTGAVDSNSPAVWDLVSGQQTMVVLMAAGSIRR